MGCDADADRRLGYFKNGTGSASATTATGIRCWSRGRSRPIRGRRAAHQQPGLRLRRRSRLPSFAPWILPAGFWTYSAPEGNARIALDGWNNTLAEWDHRSLTGVLGQPFCSAIC